LKYKKKSPTLKKIFIFMNIYRTLKNLCKKHRKYFEHPGLALVRIYVDSGARQ
jgi:hypothetical protein